MRLGLLNTDQDQFLRQGELSARAIRTIEAEAGGDGDGRVSRRELDLFEGVWRGFARGASTIEGARSAERLGEIRATLRGLDEQADENAVRTVRDRSFIAYAASLGIGMGAIAVGIIGIAAGVVFMPAVLVIAALCALACLLAFVVNQLPDSVAHDTMPEGELNAQDREEYQRLVDEAARLVSEMRAAGLEPMPEPTRGPTRRIARA